jgi:hypothetical protein
MLEFGGSCRAGRCLSAYHDEFTLTRSDMIEF